MLEPMPKAKPTVDQFLANVDHSRKAEIEAIRALILGIDPGITEQIKWNAPSFCDGGDDRVTMRLQPQNRLELIFHRGAKVKDSQNFQFDDPTGLMVWAAKDRGVVTIANQADLDGKQAAIADLVRAWMQATRE